MCLDRTSEKASHTVTIFPEHRRCLQSGFAQTQLVGYLRFKCNLERIEPQKRKTLVDP